jgi:hypothetical protein
MRRFLGDLRSKPIAQTGAPRASDDSRSSHLAPVYLLALVYLVFDAFSQGRHAEEDSHRYEGLGLGLSISRVLVELHSGEIRAESAGLGRGSVCTIELPLVSLISAKN